MMIAGMNASKFRSFEKSTRHSGEFFDGRAQVRDAGESRSDGHGHRSRGPRRAARP
jgi:hypothetical protein